MGVPSQITMCPGVAQLRLSSHNTRAHLCFENTSSSAVRCANASASMHTPLELLVVDADGDGDIDAAILAFKDSDGVSVIGTDADGEATIIPELGVLDAEGCVVGSIVADGCSPVVGGLTRVSGVLLGPTTVGLLVGLRVGEAVGVCIAVWLSSGDVVETAGMLSVGVKNPIAATTSAAMQRLNSPAPAQISPGTQTALVLHSWGISG